jgi:hypothetical protein
LLIKILNYEKTKEKFYGFNNFFFLIITLQAQTPLTQAVDFNVTDTDGK